ncbi:MAG: hypothetical protein H8E61_05365 [Bacteroidetes bacterium]|nr:hypothetical protein [Bacteroidota bacterium]
MATPDEKQILSIMDKEGGECTLGLLMKRMGLRRDYLKSILESMGHRDLIDFFRNGKCRIAGGGWRALGKSPRFTGGDQWWSKYTQEKPGRDVYADYVQEQKEKKE